MALDFPTSPTNGQVYGNFVYSSAKGAWQAKPITGKVTTSATAPSAPTNGDEWFNTNDGNLYVYYTDVDGSQWVQVKSDATLSSTLGTRVESLESKPTGLVCLVPTSITISSGSGSANSLGAVSFTSATNVALDGVFTTGYRNYKIVYSYVGSTNDSVLMRFRTSGATNTTSNYYGGGLRVDYGASSVNYASNAGSSLTVNETSASVFRSSGTIEVQSPMVADWTVINTNAFSGWRLGMITSSGAFTQGTLFDGFNILPSTGTITGNIQVFGYND